MSEIILNVVIILGIIIAGGFLIFFVGDLLLSILDPDGDDKKIKAKRKKDVENFNSKIKELDPKDAEEIKKQPEVAAILEKAKEDEKSSRFNKKTEASFSTYEEESENQVKEQQEEKEKEDEEDEEEEREKPSDALQKAREALEKRKAEILRRLQQNSTEDEDEDEEEEKETEPKLEVKETNKIFEEEDDEDESNDEDEKESQLEEMRRSLEEEKAKYRSLVNEMKNKKSQETKIVGTKDSYVKKLREKEKALEANEKELKSCRREYNPLLKVQNTLEKDEKKLRIKEAQVAKQKVLLYGVNNYSDIDEEKAKKLSEDLDLLEGLKLSVQHCREVIASNKDRIPVLEKMNNLLEKQNEELKNDIEDLKKIIEDFD